MAPSPSPPNPSKKRLRAYIISISIVLLLVVVVVVVLYFSITYYTTYLIHGASLSSFIVGSGSMVPTYNVGDLLIVKRVANHSSAQTFEFNSIKVGEPILFKNPVFYNQKGHLLNIVHRAVQIYHDSNGQRIVKTKGDANPASIPGLDYPIYQRYFIGKVIYDIPKVGLIVRAVEPPNSYIVLGALVFAITMYFVVYRRRRHLHGKGASSASASTAT